MPAIEPMCALLKINFGKYSSSEKLVLEAEFFLYVYQELKKVFKKHYKDYLSLLQYNKEKEESMLEENFVRCVIKDLLSMEDYSIAGIACYTNIPEDVIYELATGQNTNPSLHCIRKILELHRTLRPALYQAIVRKMIAEYKEG